MKRLLYFIAGCPIQWYSANLEQNLYKFAKTNAFPPQSTKVPLGSNVDFNILDNISEWDLGTLGGIGLCIEKMVHHYGLCKIKYS